LPLFELRKRADILLEPIIYSWINDAPFTVPSLSLLRDNCLLANMSTCKKNPMCIWGANSECKIHSVTTKKIPNVKVYLTSRIIDEIFRYPMLSKELLENKVSKISKPEGIIRSEHSLLTGKSKLNLQ
jgi:hypothetical protein